MPPDRNKPVFSALAGEGTNPYQLPTQHTQAPNLHSPPHWAVPISPTTVMARSQSSAGYGYFTSPYPSPDESPRTAADMFNQDPRRQSPHSPRVGIAPTPGQALRNSCRFCRARKIKCPGGLPCQTCVTRSIACTYDSKAKMGRPPLVRHTSKDKPVAPPVAPDTFSSPSSSSRQYSEYGGSPSIHSSGSVSPSITGAASGHSVRHVTQDANYWSRSSDTYYPAHPQPPAGFSQPNTPTRTYYGSRHGTSSQPDPYHALSSGRRNAPPLSEHEPFYPSQPHHRTSSMSELRHWTHVTNAQREFTDLTIGTAVSLFFFELFQSTEAWSVYAAAVHAWQRERAHLVPADHVDAVQLPEESLVEIYKGTIRWMVKDCVEGTISLTSSLEIPRSDRFSVKLAMDKTPNMSLDAAALSGSDAAIAEVSALPVPTQQKFFTTWLSTHPCAALLTAEQQRHLTRWENPIGWPAGWQALHLLVLSEAIEWETGSSPLTAALANRAEHYFWQLKMGVSRQDDAFLTLIAALFAWHHLCHMRARKGSVYLALACHLPNSGRAAGEGQWKGKEAELSGEESEKLALLQTLLNCQAIWTFMQMGTSDADLLRMMRFELERMWTRTPGPVSPSQDSNIPSPSHLAKLETASQCTALGIRNMTQTVIMTARLSEVYIRCQKDWSAERNLELLLRSQLKLNVASVSVGAAADASASIKERTSSFDQCLHDALSLSFRFLASSTAAVLLPEQVYWILQDCLSIAAVMSNLQTGISTPEHEGDYGASGPPSPKTMPAMQHEDPSRHDGIVSTDDRDLLRTVSLVYLRLAITSLSRLADQDDLFAMRLPATAASSVGRSLPGSPGAAHSTDPASIAALASEALICVRGALSTLRRDAMSTMLLYQRKEVEALEREMAKLNERYAMLFEGPLPGQTWQSTPMARHATGSGSASSATSATSGDAAQGRRTSDERWPPVSSFTESAALKTADSLKGDMASGMPVPAPRLVPTSSWTSTPGLRTDLDEDVSGPQASETRAAESAGPSPGPGTSELAFAHAFDSDKSNPTFALSPPRAAAPPLMDSRGKPILDESKRISSRLPGELMPPPAEISAERKTSIVWDSFWGSLGNLRSSWSAAGGGSPMSQGGGSFSLAPLVRDHEPSGLVHEPSNPMEQSSESASAVYPTYH